MEEVQCTATILTLVWQMNIPPPDMGWMSIIKKTDPLLVMK